MAKKKSKAINVTKLAAAFGAGSAKNSDLKSGAHQGRTAKNDPKKAPPGFVVVPASVATLPPGLGPPMPSTRPQKVRRPQGQSTAKPKSYLIQGAPYGGTSVWSDHSVKVLKRRKRK